MLAQIPWDHFHLNDDGSAYTNYLYCFYHHYSREEMIKQWSKWYRHIINPMKLKNLIDVSIFRVDLSYLPSMKITDDKSTCYNQPKDYSNDMSIPKIIGIFFMTIDMDLSLHKKGFIDYLMSKNRLIYKEGLDDLFDGICQWAFAKKLIQHNKKKWIKYDRCLSFVALFQPKMVELNDSDLIKIKLFGSSLYDKFDSYEQYLYLILDHLYNDKKQLIEKYYNWMKNRKYSL